MWTLTPFVTVSYGVKKAFLFLSVLEFAVGILANAFIFSVNFRDLLRRQPLSNCDIILLSLSLSRLFLHGLLFLDAIQLTYFQQMKDSLNSSYQAIIMLWMITNQVVLWLATCLSLLYCFKIVRFSHPFLLRLASCISRKISWLLLSTVFFTSFCTAFCCWEVFTRPRATFPPKLLMNNNTERNWRMEKFHFIHSFLLCSLGSLPPFLCFLVSSGVLIVSLWQHVRTMRAQTRNSCDASLEAHIIALRSLVSFLCLYMVSLCAALLSVPLLMLWHNKLGVMVCVGIMAASPSGHAAILISGNAKLRRAMNAILRWAQSSLKVRADHRADARTSELC